MLETFFTDEDIKDIYDELVIYSIKKYEENKNMIESLDKESQKKFQKQYKIALLAMKEREINPETLKNRNIQTLKASLDNYQQIYHTILKLNQPTTNEIALQMKEILLSTLSIPKNESEKASLLFDFTTNYFKYSYDCYKYCNQIPFVSEYDFDFKDNIVYIVLGIVLIISLILLVYGIVSKNSQSKVPVTPPASMKPEMKITVEDYKLTVPAGLDYQIEGKSVFISDDEKYNFSFRINKGDYDNYSKNMDTLSEELKKSNYNIKSAEKKTIGEDELLVYTISLDSDIKYLYLTKYNSEKISMGVISIHNKTNIDEICKVILKVTKSVKYDNESEDKSSETVNSDTAFKETSSIVNGVKNLLF